MEASHFCMAWRGVKGHGQQDDQLRDAARSSEDPNLRREFLSLIPR